MKILMTRIWNVFLKFFIAKITFLIPRKIFKPSIFRLMNNVWIFNQYKDYIVFSPLFIQRCSLINFSSQCRIFGCQEVSAVVGVLGRFGVCESEKLSYLRPLHEIILLGQRSFYRNFSRLFWRSEFLDELGDSIMKFKKKRPKQPEYLELEKTYSYKEYFDNLPRKGCQT